DVVLASCSDEYGSSAQEVVDAKRRYNFSEQDSQVLSERTGSLDAGEYWSFQGELGPTEILAINRDRKSTRLDSSHVSISYAVITSPNITSTRSLRDALPI